MVAIKLHNQGNTMFKSLLVLIVMINVAHAELVKYESKSASTELIKLTDSSVDDLISEKNPACIKDGSNILKTNKKFKSMRLSYRDCASSDAAREKQNMKGYVVNVIKLEQINAAKAKSLGLI